MDYVYICRSGDNEELRFSLRSVLKNTDCKNVWVVGGKPDWYIGNYIKVEDFGNKFDNITNCYKAISISDQISEDFVLMNDDFYILQQTKEIPLFYDGTLTDKIDSHMSKYGMSSYARVLVRAKKELMEAGISDPLCYDVHTPMMFNKTMLSYLNHSNNAPRSTYGNMYNLGGIEVKDVKIYYKDKDKDISSLSFLSTEDDSFKLILNKLISMFPDKTVLEK